MTAFATFQDLSTRIKREFDPAEQDWITALLEDAADYMRGVMRNQVYPPAQSTYVAYPVGGWVNLPQSFITSVDAVVFSAVTDALYSTPTWYQEQDSIFVGTNAPVTVTFSYGVETPPNDLVGINCAIVTQMMLTVEAGLGLTAGGLSSVALDDFKAAFADGGVGSGMTMSANTQKYLEEHYGKPAILVAMTR